MIKWENEDGVALREFLARVPSQKIESILSELCPAKVTSDIILSNDAESIARTAAMQAGWIGCMKAFLGLAEVNRKNQQESGYRDMS
jgi:hypothetical protein